jgi:hypothetical protein
VVGETSADAEARRGKGWRVLKAVPARLVKGRSGGKPPTDRPRAARMAAHAELSTASACVAHGIPARTDISNRANARWCVRRHG